ncbi:MAG TPA: hypothetical protein V6C81_17940 [Planktothrix sp.]|jgi:hypothetical protein
MSSEPDNKTNAEKDRENNNFAGQFVQSLGHSVIQAPIDGVREVVNKLSDKEVIPKVQIVHAPEKAEYGTPAWNGQQLGKGAGLLAVLIFAGRMLSRR